MEENPMAASSSPGRRLRVARGVYQQPNGKYAVCVRVDGGARIRTLEAATLAEAQAQRELLQRLAHVGELPLSPRLTFGEVAARWLAEEGDRGRAARPNLRSLSLTTAPPPPTSAGPTAIGA